MSRCSASIIQLKFTHANIFNNIHYFVNNQVSVINSFLNLLMLARYPSHDSIF